MRTDGVVSGRHVGSRECIDNCVRIDDRRYNAGPGPSGIDDRVHDAGPKPITIDANGRVINRVVHHLDVDPAVAYSLPQVERDSTLTTISEHTYIDDRLGEEHIDGRIEERYNDDPLVRRSKGPHQRLRSDIEER